MKQSVILGYFVAALLISSLAVTLTAVAYEATGQPGADNIQSTLENGAGSSARVPKGLLHAKGVQMFLVRASSSSSTLSYDKALSQVLRDKDLEAATEHVKTVIDIFEQNYFVVNGHYWHGLSTHSSVPEYDEPTAPDRLDVKPDDVDLTWTETGIDLPSVMPFSVEVNVFQAPSSFCPGHEFGYSIVFETKNENHLFSKTMSDSICSEASQSYDWR